MSSSACCLETPVGPLPNGDRLLPMDIHRNLLPMKTAAHRYHLLPMETPVGMYCLRKLLVTHSYHQLPTEMPKGTCCLWRLPVANTYSLLPTHLGHTSPP